jgi:gamma-butyrobetaine hydroxylase
VTIQELRCYSDCVTITWQDGHRSEYHATWLLDNDPAHRDARTGQRLIDIADLPEDLTIEGGCYSADDGLVQLSWSDLRCTAFPIDWLLDHCPRAEHVESAQVQLWDHSTADLLNRLSYAEVLDSSTVRLDWLETLATLGIAFLTGVPVDKDKVLEVAALIGWVRDTNYGRVFDVRAVPDPNNLAYTGLALGLHTDNPYRDPVPGLQVLHCLRAGAEGGVSLFVDGLAVADALRSEDPEAFHVLASTPVRFEFADSASHLWAERPIIQLSDCGRVEAVHYNSRSIAPLRLPLKDIPEFYRAYRAFARLLRDESLVVSTALTEGELVAFDNRRVLHGRTAFYSADARWLQGCYLDHDGLRSRIAVLKRHGHD